MSTHIKPTVELHGDIAHSSAVCHHTGNTAERKVAAVIDTRPERCSFGNDDIDVLHGAAVYSAGNESETLVGRP